MIQRQLLLLAPYLLVTALATPFHPLALGAQRPTSVAQRDTLIESLRSRRQLDSTTIALLREQTALSREYSQRMEDTTHFAVNATLGIALLLVGFGWLANFKVYERDKEALKNSVQSDVKAGLADVQQQIALRVGELEKSISERFTRASSAAMQTGSDAAEGVKEELGLLRDTIEDRIVRIEMELTQSKADYWHGRRVYTNEIRALITLIGRARQINGGYWVAKALDQMRLAFKEGANPDASLASELTAVLDDLPAEYAADVENLREALRAARG